MLGIKEAMQIARAVRPDLQSCDEEIHSFVFYAGDEFYGDRIVMSSNSLKWRTALL